jgi:RNA polymerase sigma-B factor
MISEAIQELPVRQQQILKLRFDEDLTQTEIGELLDISQMHVSRLLGRAIEELRVRIGESE